MTTDMEIFVSELTQVERQTAIRNIERFVSRRDLLEVLHTGIARELAVGDEVIKVARHGIGSFCIFSTDGDSVSVLTAKVHEFPSLNGTV